MLDLQIFVFSDPRVQTDQVGELAGNLVIKIFQILLPIIIIRHGHFVQKTAVTQWFSGPVQVASVRDLGQRLQPCLDCRSDAAG